MSYTPKLQQNPSVKPTYVDFGDGAKENDPIYTPTAQMPKAEEYNEMGGSLEGLLIMSDLASIQMTNTAGTYSKVKGKAINKNFVIGDLNNLADGSVTITKNGVGDLTFQFDVGIIPTIEFPPTVSFNHVTSHQRSYNSTVVDGRTVRVMLYNAGSAAEALFTLYVKLCHFFLHSRHSACSRLVRSLRTHNVFTTLCERLKAKSKARLESLATRALSFTQRQ
jgi:hypothetical protein